MPHGRFKARQRRTVTAEQRTGAGAERRENKNGSSVSIMPRGFTAFRQTETF